MRQLLVPVWIATVVVTGVFLIGCAPNRSEETPSQDLGSNRGEDVVDVSGGIGGGRADAETCLPENVGPLGIRVKGAALSPDRTFRTNDRKDWPNYAPPERVLVTLPEMPSELSSESSAGKEDNPQSKGRDGGGRSSNGN
ncbi:hypothetical protein JCM17478_07480 [Thermopirellula anaerolimosa]